MTYEDELTYFANRRGRVDQNRNDLTWGRVDLIPTSAEGSKTKF